MGAISGIIKKDFGKDMTEESFLEILNSKPLERCVFLLKTIHYICNRSCVRVIRKNFHYCSVSCANSYYQKMSRQITNELPRLQAWFFYLIPAIGNSDSRYQTPNISPPTIISYHHINYSTQT